MNIIEVKCQDGLSYIDLDSIFSITVGELSNCFSVITLKVSVYCKGNSSTPAVLELFELIPEGDPVLDRNTNEIIYPNAKEPAEKLNNRANAIIDAWKGADKS